MSEHRRKRISYRAWHRGTREMDLILGSFADRWLESMSEIELVAFETLLDEPDPNLFDWIVGSAPPDAGLDRSLIERLRGHRFSIVKVDAGP